MLAERRGVFWIAGLAAVALLLVALHSILWPFLAGAALAYMLDPLVDRLQRLRVGRLWASLLVLGLLSLVLLLAFGILIPVVARQLAGLARELPGYAARLQAVVVERGGDLLARYGGADLLPDLQGSVGNLVSVGGAYLTGLLSSLWQGGQALINVFGLLVVVPVVAFYLLVDWDRMVAAVDSWLPRPHLHTIRRLAREIDRALAGFVRGQASVCLFLGVFYAGGLSLVGLNFALVIGTIAGLLTVIPYVGSIVGFVLAVGVALVQFWPDWSWIMVTAGVFFLGQFLEGNIVSPKLVGDSVGLHPVWLIFALLAFGTLFGFVGLLLAVPVAAALGVLARFALERYLASPLYDDPDLNVPIRVTAREDADA